MTVDYLYPVRHLGHPTAADDTAAQGAWASSPVHPHPITLTIRPHAPDQPALPPITRRPGLGQRAAGRKDVEVRGDPMVLAIPVESDGQFVWTFTRTCPG